MHFNPKIKIDDYLIKQKYLLFIFLISISIRIVSSFIFDFQFPDANHYLFMSIELEKNLIFENDLSMPGYPFILMISNILFNNHYILDLLLSSFFPIIIYFLSLSIFKKKKIALITSLITAFYPMNIFYSFAGLSENSFVFFIYLSFLFFYNKKYYSSFFFLILATYIRPVSEFFIPILIMHIMLNEKNNIKQITLISLKFAFLYCVFFSPWWIYNYNKYDTFVRTTLGTGQVLYLGNNKDNLTGGNNIGVDGNFEKFQNITDPIQKNKVILNETVKFILDNPLKFINLSFKKFIRYWNVFPNNENLKSNKLFKYVIFLSFFPILTMFCIYIFKNYKKRSFQNSSLLFLFVLYMTAIHVITISSLRYRYPIEPILIIFAGKLFSDFLFKNKYLLKISKK